MNYKLAKQLFDKGFPFGDVPKGVVAVTDSLRIDGDWYLIPTLEELIDAMPMRKKYLGTVNDAHFVLRKLVGNENIYRAYYEDEDTNESVPGYEFTEKEASVAVAKLWLKLNDK